MWAQCLPIFRCVRYHVLQNTIECLNAERMFKIRLQQQSKIFSSALNQHRVYHSYDRAFSSAPVRTISQIKKHCFMGWNSVIKIFLLWLKFSYIRPFQAKRNSSFWLAGIWWHFWQIVNVLLSISQRNSCCTSNCLIREGALNKSHGLPAGIKLADYVLSLHNFQFGSICDARAFRKWHDALLQG